MHAQRVVDLGLGVMLDKGSVTTSTLREAVERVAHDEAYRERAQRMQQSVRAARGYQRAVDTIMQFTEEHMRVHQA